MLKQGNTLGVKQHRIVGVGLSVVDIFSSVDENFLRKLAFDKGTTNPVSPDIFARVLRSLSNPRVEGGGQIANTLRLLSQLGHPCSFLTRVNRDTEAGNFFVESIEKLGIQLIPPADPSLREPLHCILLVTPDGESTQISLPPNVTAMTMDDVDLIPPASLMYLDGYLLNNIENSEVLFASVKRAVSIGTRHIAFNTSNITWVQEFVQEFQELITSGVSILIGTESEIRCLFAPDFSVNCDELVSLVRQTRWTPEIVVITRGSKGAIGIQNGEVVNCPAVSVAEVVDSTGGGDALAAGLFHGILQGLKLYDSLRLGVQVASWVIGEVGAVPSSACNFLSEFKQAKPT